jgi:hypothetical protein
MTAFQRSTAFQPRRLLSYFVPEARFGVVGRSLFEPIASGIPDRGEQGWPS